MNEYDSIKFAVGSVRDSKYCPTRETLGKLSRADNNSYSDSDFELDNLKKVMGSLHNGHRELEKFITAGRSPILRGLFSIVDKYNEARGYQRVHTTLYEQINKHQENLTEANILLKQFIQTYKPKHEKIKLDLKRNLELMVSNVEEHKGNQIAVPNLVEEYEIASKKVSEIDLWEDPVAYSKALGQEIDVDMQRRDLQKEFTLSGQRAEYFIRSVTDKRNQETLFSNMISAIEITNQSMGLYQEKITDDTIIMRDTINAAQALQIVSQGGKTLSRFHDILMDAFSTAVDTIGYIQNNEDSLKLVKKSNERIKALSDRLTQQSNRFASEYTR
jgi:molybdopterin converting factor small subunit